MVKALTVNNKNNLTEILANYAGPLPTIQSAIAPNSIVQNQNAQPINIKPVVAQSAATAPVSQAQPQYAPQSQVRLAAPIINAPRISSVAPVRSSPTQTVSKQITPKLAPIKTANGYNKGSLEDLVTNYINPLGENGIFGAKSIAENTNNVNQAADATNSAINSAIGGTADGQLNDIRDVARFVADLPAEVVRGVGNIPSQVSEAITGNRTSVNDQGIYDPTKTEQLDTAQRVGAGANAALSALDILTGGEATIAREALGAIAEKGIKNVAKTFFKDAMQEGTMNAGQSLASDLQTNGELNNKSVQNAATSFALGAAGGGLMSSVGQVIGSIRHKVATESTGKGYDELTTLEKAVVDEQTNKLVQDHKDALTETIAENAPQDIQPVSLPAVDTPTPDLNIGTKPDTGKTFYHGTNNKDLKNISDLLSGKESGSSTLGYTYITENPEIAKNFGSNVVSQKLYGRHLDTRDISKTISPDPSVDRVVSPEFSDYKTTPLLTDREKRAFENLFVKGTPTNTIIENSPSINEYFKSKGYSTVTVPRIISDVNGKRTETIIIDRNKAFGSQPNIVDKSPVVDETGTPLPTTNPKPTDTNVENSKQKSIADKKRGLAEVDRIAGDGSSKDVVHTNNPNGKTLGSYSPSHGRISIKGVGELETYRHEAMHKAFAENLSPEQQATAFKAILRENGTDVDKVNFSDMTNAEVSHLIGNADEKLNYSLTKYIKDKNNIKDPELRKYFDDIVSGKHSTRQKQSAKVWSNTGTNGIRKYLDNKGSISHKDIEPTLSNPSEHSKRQISNEIKRNARNKSEYTPNRAVAEPTTGNKLMTSLVDRSTSLVEGVKRLEDNVGIKDRFNISETMRKASNARNEVLHEIKNTDSSKISKFVDSLRGRKTSDTEANVSDFSEYLKLKGTQKDHDLGLEYNRNYLNPEKLKELDNQFKDQFEKYQDVWQDVRNELSPFLNDEAKDAMSRDRTYIPMRRDMFKDKDMADAIFGNISRKESKDIKATQNVVKGKQGGSKREIKDPVDTLVQMYTAAKQARYNNDIISYLAEPRFGFKKIGKYATPRDGYVLATYFKNGQAKSIEIPEQWGKAFAPRIPKVVQNNMFHKIASGITKPVRIGATSANIAWQVANVPRDVISNAVRTDQTGRFITSIPKAFVQSVVGGDAYKLALKKGIANNTKIGSELKNVPVAVLTEALSGQGAKGKFINVLNHPINTVKSILNLGENITRVAELDAQLRAGRAKGMSGKALEDWASEQAMKHLPDYSQSGTATAVVGAYKPYLTASVAGIRPLARALKERPLQTTAKLGAVVAASTLNALVQGTGNLGKTYDDLKDDDKNHAIVAVMSDNVKDGRADTIKMPLSPDLYAFNALGNLIADVMRGKKTDQDIKNLAGETISSATPISIKLGEGDNPLFTAVTSLMPTIAAAGVQTALGVNYAGKKQYDKYASEWAKGFSDVIKGAMSPAQVQQLGNSLLSNIVSPEKMLDVKGKFAGSYTGGNDTTTVNNEKVEVYKPSGSSIQRIKAKDGETYELTYGNELAKDNNRIKRLDGENPKYTGSVEGLDKSDIKQLAKTDNEVTREIKGNSYDEVINYLSAFKKAEDKDIATKDTEHQVFGKSLTTSQNIEVAKINKEGNYDYKFQQLYKDTSKAELKALKDTNPELAARLVEYDNKLANADSSGSSSDSSSLKYKDSKTSRAGTSASLLSALKSMPTAKLGAKPTVKAVSYKTPNVKKISTSVSQFAPIKVSARSRAGGKDKTRAM